MEKKQRYDFSLMSWSILAPCWVNKEWYPSMYQLANDHQKRMEKICSEICSCHCDVVMIQEAQEDLLPSFEMKLGEKYFFQFAANNPSTSSIPNGLVTLIKKDWIYSKEVKMINAILDPNKGEAIQIVHIPSKDLFLVNLHLDYMDSLLQAKMVKEKFHHLTNSMASITILAGDLNAEIDLCEKFQWIGYQNVFDQTNKDHLIPSHYPDPLNNEKGNVAIDHIYYDLNRVLCVQSGKAFDRNDQSLEDALQIFGSDHIYIWAHFHLL